MKKIPPWHLLLREFESIAYKLGAVFSDKHLCELHFNEFEEDSVGIVGTRTSQFGLASSRGAWSRTPLGGLMPMVSNIFFVRWYTVRSIYLNLPSIVICVTSL